MSSSRSNPFRLRDAASVALLTALVVCACDRNENKRSPDDSQPRPLLEPARPKKHYLERCQPVTGGRPVTLRSTGSSKGGSAVEVGDAVATGDGFAVGVLKIGKETLAQVVYVDGRGVSQAIELSRVHGPVEPPRLAAVGDALLAVVVDNDAGHTRLRVARVTSPAQKAEVKWGPEIRVRRGETQAFSIAAGRVESEPSSVLAWDDFDKSRLKSSVRTLAFHPVTLRPHGGERLLSPADEDALAPQILTRASSGSPGYWAVWLAYREASAAENEAAALVDEPPRVLRARPLDDLGEAMGDAIALSPARSNVLVYDALALPDGSLAVAYRSADSGRIEGASPIEIRIVGLDGSVKVGGAEHPGLGLGAPSLLSGDTGLQWLAARGHENDNLLGTIDRAANVSSFAPEAGLSGRVPLAMSDERMLVMQPEGLDLRLSTVICNVEAPAGPPDEGSSSP